MQSLHKLLGLLGIGQRTLQDGEALPLGLIKREAAEVRPRFIDLRARGMKGGSVTGQAGYGKVELAETHMNDFSVGF